MNYTSNFIQLLLYIIIGLIFKILFKRMRSVHFTNQGNLGFKVISISSGLIKTTSFDFDLFRRQNIPENYIWNKLIESYQQELKRTNALSRTTGTFLQKLLPIFSILEKIAPPLILLSFFLFFTLDITVLMTFVKEGIHFFIVFVAVLAVLSVDIPIKAYHLFTEEQSEKEIGSSYIIWLFLLMHFSFIFRAWGFYWIVIDNIRWLFKKDE